MLSCFLGLAQSLGKERIDKLDKAILRLTIDKTGFSGTGFVINEKGYVATCNHVIRPAFNRHPDSKKIISIKGITGEFKNGDIVKYVVLPDYYGDDYLEGLKNDFIILAPKEDSEKKYAFLKIGYWSDVEEGDEIFTAGFPLSIKQRVISKGVFSTKYEATKGLVEADGTKKPYNRKEAWVDLTLNSGNSGGPIILLGRKPKHDKVIGLATFLWNPYANQSAKISKMLNDYEKNHPNNDLNVNKLFAYVLEALSKNSLGISGAVPIDGVYQKLQELNREEQ